MKIKLFLGLLLLTPILIFLAQNNEPVSFRFLTWIFILPQAAFIFAVLLFGFFSGFLAAGLRQRKKRKKQALAAKLKQQEETAPETQQETLVTEPDGTIRVAQEWKTEEASSEGVRK